MSPRAISRRGVVTTPAEFSAEVGRLEGRLAEVGAAPGMSEGVLADLSATVEELRVAEEELRSRQEALDEAAAEAVRERERFRVLFEQAPVAYLEMDAHGLISEANAAAVALFRVGRFGLVGK